MRSEPLRTTSWAANLIKHQVLKQRNQRRSVSAVSERTFEEILQTHASGENQVFLHVGLSDIKSAFDTNPYEFLLSKVEANFESILAPGFTDYFKMSGVYHKEHSQPKHGMFSKLFMRDAEYRTDDAIKSILVDGPYRFEGCVHDDSYHPDGCFAKLVGDDVLVMDIGVPWITCSHLHYFEHEFGVPYMTDRTYEGVQCGPESACESISQTCGQYVSKYYSWNKPKIQRELADAGVLEAYDLNGLQVLFFTLGDVEDVIGDKLRDDPYYLVTL